VRVELTGPQYDFVTATERFPALVAGFGAGKTHAAVTRAIVLKLQYPRQNVAYYLPTYDLVTTIAFPRFIETLEAWGLRYKQNKNDKMLHVEGAGSFIFRTMDAPERIIGYEVARSAVDELDTLPPGPVSDALRSFAEALADRAA